MCEAGTPNGMGVVIPSGVGFPMVDGRGTIVYEAARTLIMMKRIQHPVGHSASSTFFTLLCSNFLRNFLSMSHK